MPLKNVVAVVNLDMVGSLREEKLKITRKRSIADLVAQASATLAVFGSFGFIAYRTVQGAITLGDMVMYFGAFQRGLSYLKDMLGGLADVYENNLFLSNLYEFLDLKPKVKEPLHSRPVHPAKQKRIIDEAMQNVDKIHDQNSIIWMKKLSDEYPSDIGILSPLLFNLICLEPGQALFLPAQKAEWVPSFGLDQEMDWLKNMQDWMISKKRYWGLALPIWECDALHASVTF